MKRFITVLTVFVVLFALLTKSYAAGSGAFRIEVQDAEALGKGGAFVGEADNASAVYYNPAGMTQLKGENHVSLGFSIIQPFTDYQPTTGDDVQMRRASFLIPNMFFVSDFGLEKVVFGLGATSSWGLGTEWAEDSFARYTSTKADMFNKDVFLSGAYEINEKLSIGASVDYDSAYVNKKKKLWQNNVSDGDFQLKGKAQGWGYRLSSLFKINEDNQFGIQYRSPIKEKYRGKAYLNNLQNGAGVPQYNTIFGGSSYSTEFSSELTLPQSVVAGYSYTPSDRWRINLDIEWMDWSSIEQEFIQWEDVYTTGQKQILGGGNPSSKDYRSTMSAGLGAEYVVNEDLRLRGGYLFHQTPIEEGTFHPNLPDTDSHSVTAGFGYDLRKDLVLDFSYLGMFKDNPYIDTSADSSAVVPVKVDGKYKNFTQVFTVTLGYSF